MSIRIGVIGTGIMGTDHARILHRDVPGADVVMLADIDEERARALAEEIPGCRVSSDPSSLISSPEVDAVVIASSDLTHAEYVLGCLRERKPVLCEKPLAPTASECVELVEAERAILDAEQLSVSLVSLGFMRRFDVGYTEMKSRIMSGALGTPLMIHSTGRGVSAPAGTNELTITGSAIHDLDVIPWLLDSPITEVSWLAPRQSPNVSDRQDPQFLLVRTADGVLSTVDIFLNATYGYDIRCEVVGSDATVALAEPVDLVTDAALGRTTSYAADWRPRFADAYRRQDRAWVESLTSGHVSPLANATDGLIAALVAEAAIISMRSGGGFVAVPTAP